MLVHIVSIDFHDDGRSVRNLLCVSNAERMQKRLKRTIMLKIALDEKNSEENWRTNRRKKRHLLRAAQRAACNRRRAFKPIAQEKAAAKTPKLALIEIGDSSEPFELRDELERRIAAVRRPSARKPRGLRQQTVCNFAINIVEAGCLLERNRGAVTGRVADKREQIGVMLDERRVKFRVEASRRLFVRRTLEI